LLSGRPIPVSIGIRIVHHTQRWSSLWEAGILFKSIMARNDTYQGHAREVQSATVRTFAMRSPSGLWPTSVGRSCSDVNHAARAVNRDVAFIAQTWSAKLVA
jgi:hypothetical protein